MAVRTRGSSAYRSSPPIHSLVDQAAEPPPASSRAAPLQEEFPEQIQILLRDPASSCLLSGKTRRPRSRIALGNLPGSNLPAIVNSRRAL